MTGESFWAVVRIDHFLEPLYSEPNKTESPASTLVSVTRLHDSADGARAHVKRLWQEQHKEGVEYLDPVEAPARGGVFREPQAAVVLVVVRDFEPGAPIRGEQLHLSVWPSELASEMGVGGQWDRANRVAMAAHAARFESQRSVTGRAH